MIKINGINAETENCLFLKGLRKTLLGDVQYKPLKYNENCTAHGSQPVSLHMRAKRRDKIALKMVVLNSTSKADATAKFNALHIKLSNSNYTTISVDGVICKLIYIGYTNRSFFGDKVIATLNFAEPNPNDRTYDND